MFVKQYTKWAFRPMIFAASLAMPTLQRIVHEQAMVSGAATTALAGYSTALNTGVDQDNPLGSPQMNSLVNDRRNFSSEYVTVALNLEYVGQTSDFATDPNASFRDTADGGLHRGEVSETVTITTKSNIGSPEEYPLVQSGLWAIQNADKDTNIQGLTDYLQGMTDSVKDSLKGAEIKYVLRHAMVIQVKDDRGAILQDGYDDKSIDYINGYERIAWEGSSFTRKNPDFTQAPDYQFFYPTIDALGKQLLEAFRKHATAAGGKQASPPHTYPPYPHGTATLYANTWVKSTTSTRAPNVYQKTGNYNPAFTAIPCNNCANFVSQALHVGALQYDSTWQPYSTAWVNVPALRICLINQSRIYSTTLANLYPGDIAMTGSLSHVVMYTASNPARYNGHTSDRYKEPFSQHTDLSLFYDVL
ncbi:MAG: amidase domain-containing protein [Anaerolineales bacterium]